jgi:serine protease AprX
MLILRLLTGLAVLLALATAAPARATARAELSAGQRFERLARPELRAQAAARGAAPPKVSDRLRAALTESDAADVLVFLEGRADLKPAQALDDRTIRGAFVVDALRSTAEQSQKDLRQWLDGRGVAYQPYWIVNVIRVMAGKGTVAAIAARSDVRRVDLNARIAVLEPMRSSPQLLELQLSAEDVPWGIARVGAPTLWEAGIRGLGIVVAGNDTGVDWDHEALQGSYRGWNGEAADHNYNWHDAWDKTPRYPSDDDWQGHGTHTIATAVGGGPRQVGVAPDAEWVACRNMDNENGTPASYIDCFQFFLAPTDLAGRHPRPELAPHIVNNSWHCPPSEGCFLGDPLWQDTIQPAAEALAAAGIAVVASAGNFGYQGCESVTTLPGAYGTAISVGAITREGSIAGFSSRGPVTIGGRNVSKPDLTAPGTSVVSAVPDDRYSSADGTSMASPHVAGTIALLWSAAPELVGRLAVTEQLLRASAKVVSDLQCGGDADGQPNNVYGWGVVDALDAVDASRSLSQITGTVRDEGGTPLSGASIRILDPTWGIDIDLVTGTTGKYISPLLPGAYWIVVGAPAYVPTIQLVNLRQGEAMVHDIALRRAAQITYFPLVRTAPQ